MYGLPNFGRRFGDTQYENNQTHESENSELNNTTAQDGECEIIMQMKWWLVLDIIFDRPNCSQ